MAFNTWEDLMMAQGQRQVTGGPALTPQQLSALRAGEVEARYETETSQRGQALAEKTAAFNRKMATQQMANEQGAAIMSGVGQLGMMGILGASVAGKLGWTPFAASAPAIAGTGAGAGATTAGISGMTAGLPAEGASLTEGGTALSEGTTALSGGGAGSLGAFAQPVGLALAAYEGERLAGRYVGGDAGTMLRHPLTGISSEILKGASKVPGLGFMNDVGKGLGTAEEMVVQKPLDFLTSSISKVIGGVVSGKGCIVLSYMYGPESPQARTAKVFCARFMDYPALVGYYQVGRVLIRWCEKSPRFKAWLELHLGRSFFRYMRWRIGKTPGIMPRDRIVAERFLRLCRLRFALGRCLYFPAGSGACMAQAVLHEEVT